VGTGRFERSVPRRLAESGALFFGVLDTAELRPGGQVWEVALRVRLMHALVRQKLVRSGEWNTAESVPINQLHTALGPLFFGSMVVDTLRSLGARITTEEAESYRLIWRYVTWLLGVPQALLGRTDAEQTKVNEAIASVGFDPDHNSRRLAQAFLKGFCSVPAMAALPGPVHPALVERVLGKDRAARMGIAATSWARLFAWCAVVILWMYGLGQRLPFVAEYCEGLGRTLFKRMIEQSLAGAPADYQVA
jgi:hypothetical protein